jgi:hypothetical protein
MMIKLTSHFFIRGPLAPSNLPALVGLVLVGSDGFLLSLSLHFSLLLNRGFCLSSPFHFYTSTLLPLSIPSSFPS